MEYPLDFTIVLLDEFPLPYALVDLPFDETFTDVLAFVVDFIFVFMFAVENVELPVTQVSPSSQFLYFLQLEAQVG